MDTILNVFESDMYPDETYSKCIYPIACFSKSEEGKKYLKDRGFN